MVMQVTVNNLPATVKVGFCVARLDSNQLWYYGIYDSKLQAENVVKNFDNGLIVEISE